MRSETFGSGMRGRRRPGVEVHRLFTTTGGSGFRPALAGEGPGCASTAGC